MSLSIMSDQYGQYRLGDDQVIPGRMQYLQEQLQQQAGHLLTSKEIVVESFSILNDIHKPLKRSAIKGALLGPVAAISASEGDAAVIVNLHISIDSKMISAVSESKYLADIHSPKYNEVQLPENIRHAMDLAIMDIARKIEDSQQLSRIDY